ncbi:MAG: HAD family hydrolase [Bacteroidales bacterium]|nr:HAD family hydrolase [Bacteroidales bacterium]
MTNANTTNKQSLRPIVALVYDFDGTLAPGNMQEFGFIQATGRSKEEFWERNNEMARNNDANSILCYMYLMLHESRSNNLSLSRHSFRQWGKGIELFPGVEEWFDRIDSYGASMGFEVQHYINSSGLKEMIEGTPIAHHFRNIYASSYLYDIDGVAFWPATAVDYTAKTQFLFKINKGIPEMSDNTKINQFMPEEERPVPFRRMIYFGDGSTDVPSMKMVKSNGGHAIAVYAPDEHLRHSAYQLVAEGRASFAVPANYTPHQPLEEAVTKIFAKIKADWEVEHLQYQKTID